MDVLLLGAIEVWHGRGRLPLGRRRGERLLLGLLALDAGRVVPLDRLVELLWDEEPPDTARAMVQTHLARLRSALDPDRDGRYGLRLVRRGDGYLADLEPERVDAHRFRVATEAARRLTDPVARAAALRAALAHWRGPLLADVASDRVRDRIGTGLEELRLSALEAVVAADLSHGDLRRLVPELTDLVAANPLRETLTAALMRALHADGRRVDALAAYHQLRSRMDEELGLDPNPELRALHDAILRADDEPVEGVAVPTSGGGTAPEPVRPSLLPASPPYFTGRSGPLRQLDQALVGSDGSAAGPVCVIAGMAGVGKSSLALHWAHAVADRFPDGQLFVNLRGYDAPGARIDAAQAIRSFLDALTPPPHRVPASPEARADLYRSLLASRRVLIVLDNAADADHVRPLLPGSSGSLTLVTSRTQLASLVAIEGARPVQLDLLPDEEARALLARRIGVERTAAEPEAVADILARCAGLPLALAVVSARAAIEVDTSLSELAEQLRDARAALDPLPGGDLATDLRAVFSHSYRGLSPPAARLFRLLGLHAGPDVGIAAAASLAGTDRAEVRALLAELADAHLVLARADERYAFHDLLAAYAAELCAAIDPPAQRVAATNRLYDYYLHTAHRAATLLYPHRDVIELPPARPETTPEPLDDAAAGLAWLHAEYRVLTAAVHHTAAIGLHGYTWRLTWALETYAHRHARWHELVALLLEAVAATRKLEDLAGQAYTHRSLARVYVWLDRFEEGREHFGYALERYIELGDPVAQGRVHHGLTELYDRLDDHALALHHAERALALYRSANDRAGEARALNAAGWCHSKLGAHEEAVASCEQALVLFEEIGDRVGAAETWDSLGLALHHLGRYAEAADCFRRSIRMCREMGDVYHVADVLIRLGDTYTATGDPEAARTAWFEALEILIDLGHPDSATVRAKLANAG